MTMRSKLRHGQSSFNSYKKDARVVLRVVFLDARGPDPDAVRPFSPRGKNLGEYRRCEGRLRASCGVSFVASGAGASEVQQGDGRSQSAPSPAPLEGVVVRSVKRIRQREDRCDRPSLSADVAR